jgi:glycosyltransferase involved in cell wall biosynthesis
MGRLTPEKRVDWLIRAFQDLIKNSADSKHLKMVIAGSSSATHDYVKKLENMSTDDNRIIFTGYVTGRVKEELLSNALLFSLPSRLEGYRIVLLEAKSYGICCLASDIDPHREAIDHEIDGLLFKHDDISDLASKLI